ncbi:hypothetical protein LSH36_304g09030 [Paralvinella palmiformis]|uniref:Uncharacterized protein n=1 Tax=Paralvinella palmiformis TaxID=53620 RepID=A0AAD9JI67_9ANNE|nr:hypothetical protein LSH36_304g09030 [Paralvinella palmiformis]
MGTEGADRPNWGWVREGRRKTKIALPIDSVFNLQRPYDLVAMLKQEHRAQILEDLRQELLIKKERIDKSEDRDTGLEQRFYRTDPDCIAAGKRLPEFDLYISTVLPLENKGVRPEEHIDFKAHPIPHPVSPVCTEMTELHFSMEAFEHLEDHTNSFVTG